MSFMCVVPSEIPGTISVFGPPWTPSGMWRTGSDLFLPLSPPESSPHTCELSATCSSSPFGVMDGIQLKEDPAIEGRN